MDKKLYKSDRDLADRGWQNMRGLLDREMPVEHRRRPIWLFWMFGLLLCVAGYFTWLHFSGIPDDAQSAPVQHQPIAEHNANTQAGSPGTSTQEDLAVKLTSSNPKNIKPQLSIKNLEKPESKIKIPNTEINTQAPISFVKNNSSNNQNIEKIAISKKQNAPEIQLENIFETKNSIQPIQSGSAVEFHTTANATHLPDTTGSSAISNYSVSQPSPALAVLTIPTILNPLPGISNDPDLNQYTKVTALEPVASIEPVKNKMTPKWLFGLTAGVLSNLDFQYSGLTGGLAVEWQLVRNWGVRSGLSYQFQPLPNSQRSIVQVSSGSYVMLTGDQSVLDNFGVSTNLDPNILATPVYVPVSRLHRLQMPVEAIWQPFKKWRLYGGLNLGFNLYAQAGKQSLKDKTVFDIAAGTAARQLNQEVTNQLPDWDLRWSAGIGFKPNRHLAFDLTLLNPLHFSKSHAQELSSQDIPDPAFESLGQKVSESRPAVAGDHALLRFSTTVFF